MPDLDPLPGRPNVPVFRPRTGDFGEVVGRAKHRRRRGLAGAGAGVAGTAAVMALAFGHAPGTFSLQPVQPAAPGGAAYADPTASPTPAGETAAPSSAPGAPAGPSGTPASDPSPPPASQPAGGGDEGTEHGTEIDDERPPAPPRPPVVVRDDVANDPTAVCATDPSPVTAYGWCLRYEGPAQVRSGEARQYRVLACRHVGRGAETMTFWTDQEIELTLSGGQREDWHWSQGYRFPERDHTVRVGEGRCARWTVTWDTIGDDGDPVRPGQYWMTSEVRASDWGNGTAMALVMTAELRITS